MKELLPKKAAKFSGRLNFYRKRLQNLVGALIVISFLSNIILRTKYSGGKFAALGK